MKESSGEIPAIDSPAKPRILFQIKHQQTDKQINFISNQISKPFI